MLEVDHIIAKSKWWDDNIDNLITACFDCNRWKWKQSIQEPKNIWKDKINNNIYRAKYHFYNSWNNASLWTLSDKEKTLVSMYCKDKYFWLENNNYLSYLWFPPLYYSWDFWQEPKSWKDYLEKEGLFLLWWDYCDAILEVIQDEIYSDIEYMIKEVIEDENRAMEWRYNIKLNYELTIMLSDYWYRIKKYTLYPNMLSDGES